MSDEICLRRTRTIGVKFKYPRACVHFPRGEFRFYEKTLQACKIDRETQAFMFYIDKISKTVRVEIETKAHDNYHLSDAKGYYRFTNKQLGILFSDTLNLDFEGNYYFKIEDVSNNQFKMILENAI